MTNPINNGHKNAKKYKTPYHIACHVTSLVVFEDAVGVNECLVDRCNVWRALQYTAAVATKPNNGNTELITKYQRVNGWEKSSSNHISQNDDDNDDDDDDEEEMAVDVPLLRWWFPCSSSVYVEL